MKKMSKIPIALIIINYKKILNDNENYDKVKINSIMVS